MRIPTRLLVLPLLIAYPERAILGAQIQAAHVPALAAADSIPVSVRWNRLVPTLVDQAAARRRAARSAAKTAGDSAALRRIAQSPPPILFRVYTVLSVAKYGAVNSARDDRAASADVAVAAASAAVLTQVFTDSAVRASIARELARDIDQAQPARAEWSWRWGADVWARTSPVA